MPDEHFGATGVEARDKRSNLFGADESARAGVVAEGLHHLDAEGASGSRGAWWAFEGFTAVDFCVDTPECLLFVEGKRTDVLSPSTRWLKVRNQLWRNVEVASELAGERPFGVILAVEQAEDGQAALKSATATRDSSYPHLAASRRAESDPHFLGYVVWGEIVQKFGLPPLED